MRWYYWNHSYAIVYADRLHTCNYPFNVVFCSTVALRLMIALLLLNVIITERYYYWTLSLLNVIITERYYYWTHYYEIKHSDRNLDSSELTKLFTNWQVSQFSWDTSHRNSHLKYQTATILLLMLNLHLHTSQWDVWWYMRVTGCPSGDTSYANDASNSIKHLRMLSAIKHVRMMDL